MVLSLQEVTQRLAKLDGWELEGSAIVKNMLFDSFQNSIAFVNKVAEVAEKYNHHPEISINYQTVRLVLTTHEQNALTEMDFKVAEEIDKIKS